MIDPKIIPLLRCPLTGEPLAWATDALLAAVNEAIQNERICNRGGAEIAAPLVAALVGGDWLYPVRDGIPALVPEEGIAVERFRN